jgi:Sec-independent protein translocase protein TatA
MKKLKYINLFENFDVLERIDLNDENQISIDDALKALERICFNDDKLKNIKSETDFKTGSLKDDIRSMVDTFIVYGPEKLKEIHSRLKEFAKYFKNTGWDGEFQYEEAIKSIENFENKMSVKPSDSKDKSVVNKDPQKDSKDKSVVNKDPQTRYKELLAEWKASQKKLGKNTTPGQGTRNRLMRQAKEGK